MGGWNKRDVTRLRTQMLKQGRGIDEIAVEIRHLCRCSYLAAYRMAHGLSQPEVVDRYLAIAPDSAIDQPLLSRLEMFPSAGSRTPRATQIITLAGVYGTTPLRLLAPDALDRLDSHERAALLRCDTSSARSDTVGDRQDVCGQTHPSYPVGPSEVAEPLDRQVAMAARRARGFAAMVETSNVGPETLHDIRDAVIRLACAYTRQPLPILLADLIDLQETAFRLLEGHQRPVESREMYLLTGAICGMLAKASHDLGDSRAAMTQARTAYICAGNAGHRELRAWARALQSGIAYRAGWLHDAVRYAELGIEACGQNKSSVAIWLLCAEARAQAKLAIPAKARYAIALANERRGEVTPGDLDMFGGEFFFQPYRQHYMAAGALVLIPGEERRAESEAQAALKLHDSVADDVKSFATEAGARAELALARVHMDELEGAQEALTPVLGIPSEQRIYGLVETVSRIHGALCESKYRDSRLARTIQRSTEMFCRSPLRLALPRWGEGAL
ncbi:hypothetical protein AB0K60_03950 [Thermopolyspora sp. NPDC052614]|uniref:hypothetical protein n=1 Tax=Thermopolyspora sp. NPDC052614 TaxID=3155682 RepID=UPI00342CBD76